jgi:anti-sigma B factor antagonist
MHSNIGEVSLHYIDWERDGVLVLNLTGKLVLGEGTRSFRQLIQDALAIGKKDIILNLGEVVHIDSSGLGELVTSHSTVRREGGRMKLVKLTPRAHALVNLTKLHTVFEIYEDEDTALRSFRPPAA